MKKLNSVYVLFLTMASAILFFSNYNSPPPGNTGAPPNFTTCNSCHSGAINGSISITGMPASITANTTYPISVTLTRTNTTPKLAGFQLVVQDASNNNAGTLDNPSSSSALTMDNGKTYWGHAPAAAFGAVNTVTYTIDWTSPASGSGSITMYAAGNLANDNNGTNGDGIVTTTAAGSFGGGGGAITVAVTHTNVSCWGGNNGTATANPSGGGGGPYSYAWSNGSNNQTATNLPAGSYSVTVTNTAGGSGIGTANITQPSQLNAVITNTTNITCLNPVGSATVQASGGTGSLSYSWPNGASGQTANLPAGTYTVTVSDANSCTATASANILSNTQAPTAEAGPAGNIGCASPTTTLNGTGSSVGVDYAYSWTTTNGNILAGANTLTPTVGAAGTYLLTVTNTSTGCTASESTTVGGDFQAPTSTAGDNAELTCLVTSLQLNGTGSSTGPNYTYLWTTSNGNIASGATTLTPTITQPATYCLLVTNIVNGCTATDCVNVGENVTPPISNAGSAAPLTCATTSLTLNGSASSSGPGISYLWTTTNGTILSGATTTMPVVTSAGTYLLTVTRADNGCTASSSVTVASNTTPPNADAGPGMALNCNNSAVVLNGSNSSQGGNFSYLWTGPGIQSGGNTSNPTVNLAGTYVLTVTNTATGCSAADNTTVVQTPALMAAVPVKMDVDCNGSNTGSAAASGSGGAGTYGFAWSNGSTTASISNLAAGTYTVTITDEDDCTATASVVIAQPSALAANTSSTGETSVGANDGTATANPTGGSAPYVYAWSNTATTQGITGLAAGNYTVTVSDANNCSSVQTVTVSSFNCSGIAVNFSLTNPSCNGSSNGSATASSAGGLEPYTYAWSTSATTPTISNLPAGSYTVTSTDENGCEATGNITLTAPAALNLSVDEQTNVACNGQANGSASIGVAGGTPAYTYAWPNGGNSSSQDNLAAGSYLVTVTDANNCTATIPVSISQPPALTVVVTSAGETSVGANDGTANAAVTGGVAPYQYAWSTSELTSSITGLPPGQYCVTVTDANGCSFTGCSTVAQFGCLGQATVISGENVTCFGGNDGTASITATGFSDPITYAWSNAANGANLGGLTAGLYSATISDANGCTSTETIEISEPSELVLMLLNQTDLECAGENSGELSVNGSGGTPGYDFSWSNGAGTPTISNLAAGTYEVILSDANHCEVTQSFEILTKPDNEAPVALAAGLTLALNANGAVALTTAMVDGGSSDNCSLDTVFIDHYSFDCSQVGENIVILTAIDAAGNSATDTTVIFVVDDILPTVLCPPSIVVTQGNCETAVEYATPLATDNCSDVTLFLSSGLPSGAVFPSGTTTVLWGADDNNGNQVFCQFTVTVESNFSVTASFVAPDCHGFADATATATPNGGVGPYGYEWNDPANQLTQTAVGLAAGTYTVFITDAQGCVATTTVIVTEPDPILVTIDQVTGETNDDSNGAISVTAIGGTGVPFFYNWYLDGILFSTDEDLTGLAAGTYVLETTDQTECTVVDSVVVQKLTATHEASLEHQVQLAPNPASSRLFVNFDLARQAAVQLQLLDLSGRPALPALNDLVQDETLSLDLTGVAPGIYLVRVIAADKVMVKRIVIAR